MLFLGLFQHEIIIYMHNVIIYTLHMLQSSLSIYLNIIVQNRFFKAFHLGLQEIQLHTYLSMFIAMPYAPPPTQYYYKYISNNA